MSTRHLPKVGRLGLQSRLLLITALVLSACLGAVGWLLDESFDEAVQTGAEEQLRAVAHGLLGAAEERDNELVIAAELGEPRLSQPDSGLYAYVDSPGGWTIWRSPSIAVAASDISAEPPSPRPAPGEFLFSRADTKRAPARFVLAYTVIWEALGDAEVTFWVLADQLPYRRQVEEFRNSIAAGLGGAAVVFIVIQFAAVRWGLTPVRRMAERIRGLESGVRRDIGDDFPRELSGLARNVNRFIAHEQANRDRYRRAMDDLAHSLKTPLAVLKNAVRQADGGAGVFREQIERMETTVGHQLSRAATVPTTLPMTSIAVMPTAARIVHALERAYAGKGVATEIAASALAVRVDERDLMEMLGNLIENAFKYSRGRVRLSAEASAEAVAVLVEDDGDGIPSAQRELVLERGTRADYQHGRARYRAGRGRRTRGRLPGTAGD